MLRLPKMLMCLTLCSWWLLCEEKRKVLQKWPVKLSLPQSSAVTGRITPHMCWLPWTFLEDDLKQISVLLLQRSFSLWASRHSSAPLRCLWAATRPVGVWVERTGVLRASLIHWGKRRCLSQEASVFSHQHDVSFEACVCVCVFYWMFSEDCVS